MIRSVDPPGCKCQNCEAGEYSKPFPNLTNEEMTYLALGLIRNDSGMVLNPTRGPRQIIDGLRGALADIAYSGDLPKYRDLRSRAHEAYQQFFSMEPRD